MCVCVCVRKENQIQKWFENSIFSTILTGSANEWQSFSMSDLMNNQEQFPFHFLQMKNFVQILDLISRNLKGIFILFFICFLRCPRYFWDDIKYYSMQTICWISSFPIGFMVISCRLLVSSWTYLYLVHVYWRCCKFCCS